MTENPVCSTLADLLYSIHGATIGIVDLHHPHPPNRMRAETDISTSKIVHPSVYNESDSNISLGDKFVATLACGISSKEALRLVWKVLKQTSGGGDETWDAFYLQGFIRKAAQR